MRDPEAVPAEERAAREKGVTYVKLDGEVGILGNGAGLVMSTLDVIALAGGRPANFCDLGGGGDAQGVVDALEVITADPQVRSIFFNIFGGITRCDEVARGILQALVADRRSSSRSSSGSTARTRRRAGGSSPRRRRPTCTSSPTMLEAAKLAVELSRMTERLERPRAGLPRQRGAPRGPRPRPVVEWAGPGEGRTALDVATGGGHVARRLREAGFEVVTTDRRPACSPTSICRAEDLPFADGSFDVVACRVAAHHFDDVAAAVREMGARQPRARARRRQPVHQRRGRGGRPASRPEPRPQPERGRVARAARGRRARRRGVGDHGQADRAGAVARARRLRRTRRRSACASCSPTASRTAGSRSPASR